MKWSRVSMKTELLAALGLLLMSTQLNGQQPTTAPTTKPADHPIVNTLKQPMTAKNRPSWSDVTSAAVLKGVNSGHFDRHYHDCNEYWLICKGLDRRADLLREGWGHRLHPQRAGARHPRALRADRR